MFEDSFPIHIVEGGTALLFLHVYEIAVLAFSGNLLLRHSLCDEDEPFTERLEGCYPSRVVCDLTTFAN